MKIFSKLGLKTKVVAIVVTPIALYALNEKMKYDYFWEQFNNNR